MPYVFINKLLNELRDELLSAMHSAVRGKCDRDDRLTSTGSIERLRAPRRVKWQIPSRFRSDVSQQFRHIARGPGRLVIFKHLEQKRT